MKGAVLHVPGGPEQLKIRQIETPRARKGEVFIQVRSFGINRSEIMTRKGLSTSVRLPRVLGIEVCGTVVECPDGEFERGAKVCSVMGGMGREFDGSYAEFVTLPARQVRKIDTELDWSSLAGLPEMLQTAWGSLFTCLDIRKEDHLLIRGGTSSVGLASIGLAKDAGLDQIYATTRSPDKAGPLLELGVEPIIDDDAIGERTALPRFEAILDLVGCSVYGDSTSLLAPKGRICIGGMLGDQWGFREFAPIPDIPNGRSLMGYLGDVDDFLEMPLDSLLHKMENGILKIPVGPVFALDEIVAAHEYAENHIGLGKTRIVVNGDD